MKAWDFFRKPGNEELHDFMGDYPVFKNELEVLPLQAADMLAWCLRRQIADHHSGSPPRPMPWPDRDNIKSLALRYQEDALRGEYVAMFEGLE